MPKRDSSELRQRLRGQWLCALTSLAPTLDQAIQRLGQNVPCPVDGGTDGFRLLPDANETGGGVKQSQGVFSNGISLLMWVNDWSFVTTYDELLRWLGGSDLQSKPRLTTGTGGVAQPAVKRMDPCELRHDLKKMWSQAIPLDAPEADIARRYFRSRGIHDAALEARNLRFHRRLLYRSNTGEALGVFPGVLAVVVDNDGTAMTLHRTYLNTDGSKLSIPNNPSKKTMPWIKTGVPGSQIRLKGLDDTGVLGVAEGIETALAVTATTGLTVWSCYSCTGLQVFKPPTGVHTVLNFVDKDRKLNNYVVNEKRRRITAAEYAALVLRQRLDQYGDYRLINLLPPTPILEVDHKGVDWADQLERDPAGFSTVEQLLQDLPSQSV